MARGSARRVIRALRVFDRRLNRGRAVTHQCGAAHISGLFHRKRPRPMHRLAVVPHDDVTRAPLVAIHALALGCLLDQVTQEYPCFWYGPADDAPCVGG